MKIRLRQLQIHNWLKKTGVDGSKQLEVVTVYIFRISKALFVLFKKAPASQNPQNIRG